MDNEKYFRTLTDELMSLKDRVRNFVQHWPTDGEWKESILRTVLRRHLPQTIGVGKGFVVTPQKQTSQIDILLYDTSKPILYQEGDLVIISPDAAMGAIEVKTKFNKTMLKESLDKLSSVAEIIHQGFQPNKFFGLFVYEGIINEPDMPLLLLKEAVHSKDRRTINCISIGGKYFVRFWSCDPANRQRLVNRWHAYGIDNKAPAYFIHNVIEHLCPQSVLQFNYLWFPESGKEIHRVSHIER